MKKLILFLFLVAANTAFAQSDDEIINKAKSLVGAKKYATAYETLMNYDPDNKIPAVVLLKEDIALNYYVNSIMHRMFSFKDIGKNENILTYRNKKDGSEMHELPINDILEKLIKKYPETWHLYKGLGEYYFAVYMTYGQNWMLSEKELFSRIEQNDSTAMEHLNSDYRTYYAMGYAYLMDEKYGEAIESLAKSVDINPNFSSAQYSLGYAYEIVHQGDKGLDHGLVALKLSKDSAEKADAARMIGYIYGERNDFDNARKYFALSDRIDPVNYNTFKAKLEIELKQNTAKIIPATQQFYTVGETNPSIINDLVDLYTDNKKQPILIAFFKTKIAETKNPERLATLYFYTGRLYLATDKSLARENFLKANELFSKIYPKDNEVFKVLENNLKKTE